MADQKKQPWGDVFAVVPHVAFIDSYDKKDDYLEIGVAWFNERDGRTSIAFTLNLEPVAWKDPNTVRRIVVQKREPRNQSNSNQQSKGRR